MDVKTVICIDNSGSTDGNLRYSRKVERILEEEKNKVVILWNSNAEIVDPTTTHFESTGGTTPSSFLNILKNFDYDFNLIVTTDGEIWDAELIQCRKIIHDTRLLEKIKSFTIYFIGDEGRMNLRISSLFNEVAGQKKILINEEEGIEIRDFNAEKIRHLTYEDFLNEKSIKANVLTMIQRYPEKIREIRAEICKVSNRIIAKDLADTSLRVFYDTNDIEGCVKFVKKADNTKKKDFQRIVSKILGLFSAKDYYSLSHLSNTSELREEDIEVEGDIDDEDDDDESENDLICDILYKKIEYLCILVKMIPEEGSTNEDKYALIPDSVSKKYSANPFMILKDELVIQRIIKRVEPQKIDLFSYNNLERESLYGRARSPFSRDQLKGVFIFHSTEDDSKYDRIYKNNNRTLSFIFGSNNKLPGNKALWNALFLYILLKHHGEWKQHEAKLKEEILFICSHAKSFVTFNPILNPTITENLDVCLWYVVKVSHKAFPNTHSNVLRSMEGSEELIEFYACLFNDEDLAGVRDQVKKWVLWKRFVRSRSDWKVKLDVVSHVQNFETIRGSKVFFSGKSTSNCFGLDPEEVMRLYTLLKQSQNPSLMDDLSKPIEVKCEPIEVPLYSHEDLPHVFVCVSTCNQLVTCPLTGLHWRECLQRVVSEEWQDVEKYSFFRLFKRFCLMYERYPEDEEELLVFHSDTYNRRHEDYIVYPMNAKECMRLVLDKFANVMKEHDVQTYLKLSDLYSAESERLKMEEQCRKCSIHGKMSSAGVLTNC